MSRGKGRARSRRACGISHIHVGHTAAKFSWLNEPARNAASRQNRPGPTGCAGNLAMRRWRTWQGNNHYLRPPPSGSPPGLARFLATTRLALKRQQTLALSRTRRLYVSLIFGQPKALCSLFDRGECMTTKALTLHQYGACDDRAVTGRRHGRSAPDKRSVPGRPSAPRRLDHCSRVTRQMVLDRSSAMISAPFGSTVTPTGRPRVLPSSPRKPVAKSMGSPAGRPSAKGTKITL